MDITLVIRKSKYGRSCLRPCQHKALAETEFAHSDEAQRDGCESRRHGGEKSGAVQPSSPASSSVDDAFIRRNLRCFAAGVTGLEWLVELKVRNNSSKRPHGGGNGYDEARRAERLEADPFGAPLRDLLLNYIHFNWEINRQGPKPKGPEDPNDVIEEGEEHRDNGAEKVEFVRVVGAGDGDLDFGGDEFVVRVVLGGGFFDEGEEGLAVDLVGADEVDDDGGVGDVEEPEWVVEAEAGGDFTVSCIYGLKYTKVSDIYLNLNKDEGVRIGKGYGSKCLGTSPNLLHFRHSSNANASKAS
nr:hypothetical protein VIGAN_02139000 [Ipomoea batatas]